MAVVVLTAQRPGESLEYAGFRVLPHIYAPPRWNLPLSLGLVAEFSFAHAIYEENPRHIELRPIVEKHIGRLQLDGNPVFSHSLQSTGPRGWTSNRRRGSAGKCRDGLRRVSNITAHGPLAQIIRCEPRFIRSCQAAIFVLANTSPGASAWELDSTPATTGLVLKSHLEISRVHETSDTPFAHLDARHIKWPKDN